MSIAQPAVFGNLVTSYHSETAANYSLEWTIGEVFNEMFDSGDVTVTSGINQSNMVLLVTGVESETTEQIIEAYPNPIASTLVIRLNDTVTDRTSFQFSDTSGRKVEASIIQMNNTGVSFNMEGAPPGFYLLIVRDLERTPVAHIKLLKK